MTRTARLEARLPPDLLAIMKQAAEVQGRSVSDFVVSAAAEAARKVVGEAKMIRLSQAATEQVSRMLLNPPAPKPALKAALRARRRLIKG